MKRLLSTVIKAFSDQELFLVITSEGITRKKCLPKFLVIFGKKLL